MQKTSQLTTFRVNGKLYGLDVRSVQEVVKPMPLAPVPHAPPFVMGLINLRGQIATAIGLLELFEVGQSRSEQAMNIICNMNGGLVSLFADEIGDVLEVANLKQEGVPPSLPTSIRKLAAGGYQVKDEFLVELDIGKIASSIGVTAPSPS